MDGRKFKKKLSTFNLLLVQQITIYYVLIYSPKFYSKKKIKNLQKIVARL